MKKFHNLSRPLSVIVLCLALVGAAHAQKAYYADHVVTVEGATHSPGVLWIEGDSVRGVGRVNSVSLPAGIEEIQLPAGSWIYPGLILATSSLGLTEISAVPASNDVSEMGRYNARQRAYTSVNSDSELIGVARAAGFTHALVHPGGSFVRGRSGLLRLAGWNWEERLAKGPVGLHIQWPSQGLNRSDDAKPPIKKQISNREEAIRELDEYVEGARAYLRAQQADHAIEADLEFEAWAPVLAGDLPLFVHANGMREIQSGLAWCTEQELRMVLVGGRDAALVAEALNEAKVPVILEQVMGLPARDFESHDAGYRRAAQLHEAGVSFAIAMGNGGWRDAIQRNVPFHAARAVAYGLPADIALRSISLTPAEICGVGDRLGSLAPGKSANFIVTTGDIFDNRTLVTHMFMEGRPTSLENRHTRLYDKYDARPSPALEAQPE